VSQFDGTTRASSLRNLDVAQASYVVAICVKPKDTIDACRQLAPAPRPKQILVSAVASIETADLSEWTESRAPIVHVMPNMPARVAPAMTVIVRAEDTCTNAVA
jgi:pyrroline-5-carboxylate reductase